MSELKQKIIQTLESIEGYCGLEHERQADAILAIPEIAMPLALCKELADGPGHGDMRLVSVCAQRALDGNDEPFAWA